MAWTVKRIQEGDYGCEERTEEERNLVIVTLENEDGLTRQVTADDDWLYAMGIDEGGIWPEEPSAFLSFTASGRRSPPPSCRSKPQKNQCKGKY